MHFDYPSPRLRGGYLCHYNGQWAIRPAVEHRGESLIHVHYDIAGLVIGGQGRQLTHHVFVSPATRGSSVRGPRPGGVLTLDLAESSAIKARSAGSPTPTGMVPAILVESGHMGGAHAKHWHGAIYEEDGHAQPISIPQEMWQTYEEDRELTRGVQTRTRKLAADGDPLFYLLDRSGKLVFFGPTMMFRLPYQRSIADLIPKQLQDPLRIDYADALFGFVREKQNFGDGQVPPQGCKERAYAGRVSVTDAVLAGPVSPRDLWLSNGSGRDIIPRILSAPKPTSFQHYLVQPAEERPNLSFYDSPQRDDQLHERGHRTVIRGHKRYWHRGKRTVEDIKAPDPVLETSTQHTQFRPVKEGVSFSFRVYFENLSAAELGALCWTLHPVGPAKEYCHSLGMGKPLGMGAVQLDAILHLTDRGQRYGALFSSEEGDAWQLGLPPQGEPLADPGVLDRYIQRFEQRILGALGAGAPGRLAEVKRIGMLLKLLEWQDAPPDEAFKEQFTGPQPFRDRPVLPDPSYGAAAVKALWEPGAEPSLPPPPPAGPPQTSREWVTIVRVGGNGRARVRTDQGGEEIDCTSLPAYPPPALGARCRADVSRTAGRATGAVFKGWT